MLLGVHIRHNDFKDFYEGKYFVPLEKYREAIAQFKKLVSDSQQVSVVLCSDDQTVLSHFQANNPEYILPMGNIAQDMYALSQCDYLISPKATTMSSWASYFGDVPILQIDSATHRFSIRDFRRVTRLEPFTPISGIN